MTYVFVSVCYPVINNNLKHVDMITIRSKPPGIRVRLKERNNRARVSVCRELRDLLAVIR